MVARLLSKRLEDTVDYRAARLQISHFASHGEFVLLESLAEGVATLCLDKFKVERVTVRVRKEKYSVEPSIGIEIERVRGDDTSVEVVIGLGSNMGRREDNVRRAVAAIGGKMRVIAVSSVYETEPMYLEDQGCQFLNCVVVVETDLEPDDPLRWSETQGEGRWAVGSRVRHG